MRKCVVAPSDDGGGGDGAAVVIVCVGDVVGDAVVTRQ